MRGDPHDAATLDIAVSAALLIDFGSTWTKLRAVDIDTGALIGTAQGPSTVATYINLGLDAALGTLSRAMRGLPAFAVKLASSSAAGGLRMMPHLRQVLTTLGVWLLPDQVTVAAANTVFNDDDSLMVDFVAKQVTALAETLVVETRRRQLG